MAGKQLSQGVATTGYAIGEFENYTSIYGYPKRRLYIHQLSSPGEALTMDNRCGFIKEERIFDEAGNVVNTVFYEKNGWRAHGTTRFFAPRRGPADRRRKVPGEGPARAGASRCAPDDRRSLAWSTRDAADRLE